MREAGVLITAPKDLSNLGFTCQSVKLGVEFGAWAAWVWKRPEPASGCHPWTRQAQGAWSLL